MDGDRIGRLHRILRHRARLTQEDLAQRIGVGRWKIVRLEAGKAADLRLGEIERCFAALDARLDVRGWYHGAGADRLLDERHSQIVGALVQVLRHYRWVAKVEVSFSDYGDRGSIDVLGWQPKERALVVAEVKSEVGSIEGTLRPLDVKCRLAAKVARDRFGWHAVTLGRVLVLPEDRTARRAIERHAAAVDAALPARSREVRTWLRQPVGSVAGVWFLTDVGLVNAKRNPSAIRRVRKAGPRSGRGSQTGAMPAEDHPKPRPVEMADS